MKRNRTLELVVEAPGDWSRLDIVSELFDLVINVIEDTEIRLIEARTNIDRIVIS